MSGEWIPKQVFRAVGCASTLIRKAGVSPPLAISRAAAKYGVSSAEVARALGERGGRKTKSAVSR